MILFLGISFSQELFDWLFQWCSNLRSRGNFTWQRLQTNFLSQTSGDIFQTLEGQELTISSITFSFFWADNDLNDIRWTHPTYLLMLKISLKCSKYWRQNTQGCLSLTVTNSSILLFGTTTLNSCQLNTLPSMKW